MTCQEHNVKLKVNLNPWLLSVTVVHLCNVSRTVAGNPIHYNPIKNQRIHFLLSTVCHSCKTWACCHHTWARREIHFSTNLRPVALPPPPGYSSLFTSSRTAPNTTPPTALPLNNNPHGFEHPSAFTRHPQSPACRRQRNQTHSPGRFIFSRERQVFGPHLFDRPASHFTTWAQGHRGWQVKPSLLMSLQLQGSSRPCIRLDSSKTWWQLVKSEEWSS